MQTEFKEKIFAFGIRAIKFLKTLPRDVVAREIVSQLMRSGTSTGASYFEAQSASSKKDYQNYFTYSLKSANESKFWFNVLLESDLVPAQGTKECQWLLKETSEVARIFAASTLILKKGR